MGIERSGCGEVFMPELSGHGGDVNPARQHFRCGDVTQGIHGHGYAGFLAGTSPCGSVKVSADGTVFPAAADEGQPFCCILPVTHPCLLKVCLWRIDKFCAIYLGHIYGHSFGSPVES